MRKCVGCISRTAAAIIKTCGFLQQNCYFSPHNDLTRVIVWLFCAPETGCKSMLCPPHFYFLQIAEGKGTGFARWAKQHNLKEMSRTLVFLQEHKIGSIEEMQERVDAATACYHELGDSIKAAEARMTEIAVLRTHIVNYARTRPVYDAYRKTGYSKRFLETHRTEITLHKAAKAAFDESNLKTLPKVKELDAEYSKLLTEKKARYPDYRKAKEEMQELLRAKKNVELFFAEEKSGAEKMKSR